jgi:predicted acylesterase/phospholipase RssA
MTQSGHRRVFLCRKLGSGSLKAVNFEQTGIPDRLRLALVTFDRKPILVDLALQGGGSHGAFTWGVLDRLLEERGLESMAFPGRRRER